MQSNQFFATAKPIKLFFIVAIPGMISMLAMSIYTVIEGMFIGKLLGETAFAAVNLAMPLVMINFSLSDLVGVGSSVQIAIALGRKDNERANRFFSASLLLIFLTGVFMSLVLFFGSPLILKLMGAEGELLSLSVKYVRTNALFSPVTTAFFAMDNYLKISGFVKSSMVINIFSSVLTGSLLFLFLGCFELGVEGSALAISCSIALCTVIALVPFILGKSILKFVKPKFTTEMIAKTVQGGAPIFLNNIAGRIAAIVINVALLKMGGQTAVAAYSVLMYAGEIIRPMIYGMSDAVQPAIGYNYGSGSLDRVKAIAKCSFAACAAVSLLGTAAMLIFPSQTTNLFINADERALVEMAPHALKLFATSFVFSWFGFVVQGFFSALEKPLPATIISVTSAMVFPIIFVVALWGLGLDGLWLNMTATCIAVDVLAYILLRKYQKKLKLEFAE